MPRFGEIDLAVFRHNKRIILTDVHLHVVAFCHKGLFGVSETGIQAEQNHHAENDGDYFSLFHLIHIYSRSQDKRCRLFKNEP
ncbi:hypothetical protein SDC9_196044 [bioreactor metagenome]|uniref:Uncharacterized protein n=1 Tax=bioreactor metagenome TaxID=1076179 RepID=A0A645IAT7_9ZZZZ